MNHNVHRHWHHRIQGYYVNSRRMSWHRLAAHFGICQGMGGGKRLPDSCRLGMTFTQGKKKACSWEQAKSESYEAWCLEAKLWSIAKEIGSHC